MKTPLKMQEKMGNSWVLVSRNVWPPHTPPRTATGGSFKFGISVLIEFDALCWPQMIWHVLGDDAASSLLKSNQRFAVARCMLTAVSPRDSACAQAPPRVQPSNFVSQRTNAIGLWVARNTAKGRHSRRRILSISPRKGLHHQRSSRHAMVPLSDTSPHPEGWKASARR
jgi:hypothetical protein